MELSAALASLLLLASQETFKEVVHESTDPPYTLRLPAGYLRVSTPDNAVLFVKSKGQESWERVYVHLVSLGVVLEPKVPPADSTFLRVLPFSDVRERKSITVPWGNLDIDGAEIHFAHEGTEMVGRCAWVPLSPKALAVCVSAPTTLLKELNPELLALLAALKGQTHWLTEGETASLLYWSWPAYAVPVLSGLFLLAWAAVFRGQSMRFHYLRVAWHGLVPATAALGWFLVQRSQAARLKLGLEAPLYLWFLVILPLTIFHLIMITHRVRMAVEMGD